MREKIFAALTCDDFMRQHWQKKPLLARAALANYAATVTRDDLMALAQRDDIESRIVMNNGRRWEVQHGPFNRRYLGRLPPSGWTLLVQGVDQILWQAARLLREFAFIPYARLDDVMVSYAAPGGGVGPHFDSYDVFLVQGYGQRRWQIGRQRNLELVADAPLKILREFRREREWVLQPGDLLYLPPLWAHNGVAIGECITYSIGFRAPTDQELGSRFLEFLQDRLDLDGMYHDPDLQATCTPGRIPSALIARMASTLGNLRWQERDVLDFIGRYLTEPKANVVFARPQRAMRLERFMQQVARSGVKLALRTRMLIRDRCIFINGESHRCGSAAARLLGTLADERQLEPAPGGNAEALRLLHGWYQAGYVELGTH
jgi:50S ribosomal protein L16 3-hydroxylase